ncbi:MAG: glycosyltransferase [Alistipes sp.]|nr:glycosyltransferase [Alistipes sp.]
MTSPLVSITVPIYKVQKDLPRCLDSLINQTLENIEIILVDDGSPDQCGNICDEYAAKDHRIKVIHKENGGSASARQVGLEMSTGRFYTVCDADDWIEPIMYERLLEKAIKEDADIVLSGFYNEYPDGRQVIDGIYNYTSQDCYILDLMYNRASVNTWCKLFKISTIREYGISYQEGINMGEDSLFLFKLLLKPLKIYTVNEAFYHYQRGLNTATYTNNITLRSVEQIEYIYNWKIDNYSDNRYKRAHLHALVNLIFTSLRAKDIDSCVFKRLTNNLSLWMLIRYKVITLKSILVGFSKLFGLRFGKMLIWMLYRFYYR